MEDFHAALGRALVIGGYGTFGIHVSRELADRGVTVTVAGRNVRKAEAAAAGLGDHHMSARIDVARSDALQQFVQQLDVVVLCAGPFSQIGSHCRQACLQAGRHYVEPVAATCQ